MLRYWKELADGSCEWERVRTWMEVIGRFCEREVVGIFFGWEMVRYGRKVAGVSCG